MRMRYKQSNDLFFIYIFFTLVFLNASNMSRLRPMTIVVATANNTKINKLKRFMILNIKNPTVYTIKTAFEAFELENNQDPQRRKEVFTSLSPLMRALVDSVENQSARINAYIFIADVKNKL